MGSFAMTDRAPCEKTLVSLLARIRRLVGAMTGHPAWQLLPAGRAISLQKIENGKAGQNQAWLFGCLDVPYLLTSLILDSNHE